MRNTPVLQNSITPLARIRGRGRRRGRGRSASRASMRVPDQLFLPFAEMPRYRVRENRRAKRIILRVTVAHGLEVVVPSAAARRHIPEVLAKNRVWIERAFKKLGEDQLAASREFEHLRRPSRCRRLPRPGRLLSSRSPETASSYWRDRSIICICAVICATVAGRQCCGLG